MTFYEEQLPLDSKMYTFILLEKPRIAIRVSVSDRPYGSIMFCTSENSVNQNSKGSLNLGRGDSNSDHIKVFRL